MVIVNCGMDQNFISFLMQVLKHLFCLVPSGFSVSASLDASSNVFCIN